MAKFRKKNPMNRLCVFPLSLIDMLSERPNPNSKIELTGDLCKVCNEKKGSKL
jgi:hypothetical protein